MGIYISNFSRASMQKRCRSELNPDSSHFNTTFKANSVVLTAELLDENYQIWKEPYNSTTNNCDDSEHTQGRDSLHPLPPLKKEMTLLSNQNQTLHVNAVLAQL
jgi:hypothetical protein